ncbi:MAG TPA: cytochrome c [Gammaproteobacteria bacterium]|nr:cytochrome c [Gammaproteobacteria bacterium]
MRCTALKLVAASSLLWAASVVAQAPGGAAARGRGLFVDRGCWQCHGLAAQGGGIAGPRLAGRVQAWAAFAPYVRRPTEEMIPYTAQVLPDSELADIFEWLRTLPPPPPVETLPLLLGD